MSATSSSQPKFQFHRISVDYRTAGGPMPVLREVDLFAREGEFVTIIGPSGCGKSTLLNLLSGLQQPASGEIRIDGRQLSDRLGIAAYMPQKDLLMPWRTILDNVILGLEVEGVPRGEARRKAMEHMEMFGLGSFEHAYPSTLSGGMRQRAAFLRTILTHREIMLLDEPFGALDALTRYEMQEWLLSLWDRLGKTILFITHDVDEAVLLSDRVYVLTARPGRVKLTVEVGLPRPRSSSVITTPRFLTLKEQLLSALREETGSAGGAG